MVDDTNCLSEGRGKYFGICTSYHHSKGCNCLKCPSYPEKGVFMFCSKGPRQGVSKRGCLCSDCMIHGKFGMEGEYFCSE